MATLLSAVVLLFGILIILSPRAEQRQFPEDEMMEDDEVPVRDLLSVFGVLHYEPAPKRAPPECVSRCRVPRGDMKLTQLLDYYCRNTGCLQRERSDDPQHSSNCLEQTGVSTICELDTSVSQECYQKIDECEAREADSMQTLGDIVSWHQEGRGAGSSAVVYLGNVFSQQPQITSTLCGDYRCFQEAARVCQVQEMEDMTRPLRGVHIPETLYCCLPHVHQVSFGKCLPDMIEHTLLHKHGQVFEAVLGREIVKLLSDSMADMRKVMQQWSEGDQTAWIQDVNELYDKFATAIYNNRKMVNKQLQDPEVIKQALGALCDGIIEEYACILEGTQDEESCDELWPHANKTIRRFATQIGKQEGRQTGQMDFKLLLDMFEECPVDEIISRIESSARESSATHLRVHPTSATLLLLLMLIHASVIVYP